MAEGWRAITKNKGVLYLVLLLSGVTFFMGLMQTLFTPMYLPLMNERTLGIVESFSAVGMLAGSMLIGFIGDKLSARNILGIGIGFSGVFLACMGIPRNPILIALTGFLFFSTLPFANTGADVLIRKNIPNEIQGRAWGLIGLISQLGYVLAYGVAGIMADQVFNPLLIEGGALSGVFGPIWGVGEGRGIGLLIAAAGLILAVLALPVMKNRNIKKLEMAE